MFLSEQNRWTVSKSGQKYKKISKYQKGKKNHEILFKEIKEKI